MSRARHLGTVSLDVLEKARNIHLVVFDVDGVLTNGTIGITDEGLEYKGFNVRDGLGIKLLHEQGLQTAVVTARSSECVARRIEELEIRHFHQNCSNKYHAIVALTNELNISLSEVAYIGDDVVDLPAMYRVGLAVAVKDAYPMVENSAHWITPSTGGQGAARDLADLLLIAKGLYVSAYRSVTTPPDDAKLVENYG